jgi:cyclophilin family peptidyl-prolyl cis-trans isomerase
MKCCCNLWAFWFFFLTCQIIVAAPVIDPLPSVTVPAGKSLTIPVTATSPNGRPLTYTITSSTNRITVEVHTNNPFWKMSVAQAAPLIAPEAFQTPFRGGLVTVTNIGDLTLMLFRDRAPHTIDVFTGLSASGFYNSNTIFHRVIPGFMIQGGDPATNGSGGPVFRYDDEFHPRAIFSGSGQLALANSGKDTDGSQFFITLGQQRFLDFGYTLFGQLLRGFNVASNVINTPRNGSDRPLADVIITRASLVTNATDTVITLTGTNFAGVSGTIQVIADDGLAGGRVTNSFVATTVTDANNEPPILYPETITNRVAVINGRLTNFVAALDMEGSAYYWYPLAYSNSASNSVFSVVNGQLQMGIIPNSNFVGAVDYLVVVSSSPDWYTYYQFYPQNQWPPYDWQKYRFVFGDTAISALGTNLVARPVDGFTNQILATFTNGVPNSLSNNFTASINWGDNATSSGVIVTNLSGLKEVRGTHAYTHSGHYPIYVTIQSTLGAQANLVSTAFVQPSVSLTRTGTSNILRWPAWATDYQLQSHTNLATSNWATVTNLPSLVGYETVVTNLSAGSNLFFRLKR